MKKTLLNHMNLKSLQYISIIIPSQRRLSYYII